MHNNWLCFRTHKQKGSRATVDKYLVDSHSCAVAGSLRHIYYWCLVPTVGNLPLVYMSTQGPLGRKRSTTSREYVTEICSGKPVNRCVRICLTNEHDDWRTQANASRECACIRCTWSVLMCAWIYAPFMYPSVRVLWVWLLNYKWHNTTNCIHKQILV